MTEFPRTMVGGVSLPRLLIGSNWFLGWSHTSAAKDKFIKGYHDRDSVAEILTTFLEYGVDAVMVGRASIGKPWIFQELKHYLQTGEKLPPLSFETQLDIIKQQVLDSINWLDERRGIIHTRRHLAATPLFKGIPNFRDTRIAMLRAETLEELFEILDRVKFLIEPYQGSDV